MNRLSVTWLVLGIAFSAMPTDVCALRIVDHECCSVTVSEDDGCCSQAAEPQPCDCVHAPDSKASLSFAPTETVSSHGVDRDDDARDLIVTLHDSGTAIRPMTRTGPPPYTEFCVFRC